MALHAKVEQARLELAEERSRHANLMQELEDLCFSANAESHRRTQADERVYRAEAERREISGQLTKALEDRALAEERLRDEQEKTSQLSEEQTALQRQWRTTERI